MVQGFTHKAYISRPRVRIMGRVPPIAEELVGAVFPNPSAPDLIAPSIGRVWVLLAHERLRLTYGQS